MSSQDDGGDVLWFAGKGELHLHQELQDLQAYLAHLKRQ
jgi:hypothetical protein